MEASEICFLDAGLFNEDPGTKFVSLACLVRVLLSTLTQSLFVNKMARAFLALVKTQPQVVEMLGVSVSHFGH